MIPSPGGRPNRLFTADRNIVLYKTGHLKAVKIHSVVDALIEILRKEPV